MKTYVSYVIQDKKSHRHNAQIITTTTPPYNFSAEPPVTDIMDWAEQKKSDLKEDEQLVITGMFKL